MEVPEEIPVGEGTGCMEDQCKEQWRTNLPYNLCSTPRQETPSCTSQEASSLLQALRTFFFLERSATVQLTKPEFAPPLIAQLAKSGSTKLLSSKTFDGEKAFSAGFPKGDLFCKTILCNIFCLKSNSCKINYIALHLKENTFYYKLI